MRRSPRCPGGSGAITTAVGGDTALYTPLPSAAPRPIFPLPSAAPAPNARLGMEASSCCSEGGGRPVFHTLADLHRQSGPGSVRVVSVGPAEYSSDGEKRGELVRDPSNGNPNVDTIFEQVRLMGAMDGPVEQHSSSGSRNFTGSGRLLSGGTVAPTPLRPENFIHDYLVEWIHC